jgi:hypothetical protein
MMPGTVTRDNNPWRVAEGMVEAGPFSYGAKKHPKGSIADLAARRRQQHERNKPVIEPKDQMVGTAKVIARGVEENLDQFHRNLGKQIRDRAAQDQAAVAMAQARDPSTWLWKPGDQVLSKKTGRTYTITGRALSNRHGAMYRYQRGQEGSDDFERGSFIADRAHQGLTKLNLEGSDQLAEKWSEKYRRSINCNNPRGFSQRAHCAGRKKNESVQEGSKENKDQETIDYVNQELAHTIKTKFNGIAWFNGGSYSYLLNIKKPNAMQASDGSPIRVKSWAQGIKDYADRWVWDELENSYPDYWETFLRPYKKGEGQPEHEYHSRFGESVTEGSRKFNWYNFMRTIYKLYLANAKFSSADLKADVSDVMLSSDKFFPTEYADALSESLEEGNVSWILQDVKYALREIHENVIDYYSNSWNFPPGFKPGKFSIAFKGVNSNVLKKVIIPLLPKAKKVAEVQQQGVAEGQSQNSKQSLNFCSDKTPKSTGLTFEQLNKLTESAGMDFEKFDTALKKNLNLPAWVNTLEIFGVYARKLNEQKNGRLLVETQLTDIEKNLFNELDRYSNESIDSAKIGDKVALLHLQTIDIPGHKVVAQLNGFLHPKEITGITSNKGFKQLKFADGSMFPKNDDDIAFHMIQSWNMTKLFPNYDSASKAYLMFAIQGDNQNKDLEFKINVAKNMNEGDVIHTKFATKQAQRGRDRYHKVEGLDIPVFDRAVGRAMPPNLAKDPMPFDHFVARRGKIMNRGVTKQGNWYSIIGVLPNGKEYTASTTPSEQLANALADAYNRGGFSDTDLKRVPVKGYDESTAPITKRYVLYLNDKPAAHYASKSEAESQAAMVLAKHPNTKYKILAKNQGMLESNNKGKNMRLKELTEGISSQDLGNVLFDRLEHRFPDIVAQHGHEVVADAVMHVAEFHAGAEELGSSDISIMLKQILEYIKDRQ